MELQPKTYIYKDDPVGKPVFGLIAQELENQFPEFVQLNPVEGNTETSPIYTVNYAGLSVVAIKAIQEQQAIIETQEVKITRLEKENQEMKVLLLQIMNKPNTLIV